MTPSLPESLAARLLFVVGKGGVGKTTTAAALALNSAQHNKSTHLLSIDPAHSLADVLEQPLSIALATSPCNPLLVIEQFDAAAYARSWIDNLRPVLARLLELGTYLDSDDADRFLQLSLPGVDEVMAALRILEIEASDCQRIIVDTAPTGHLLRLLAVPAVLSSWADALEAIQAKADAVALALVGQPAPLPARHTFAAWRTQSQRFSQLLSQADWLAVTQEAPVTSAETARLVQALQSRRLPLRAVLANGGPSPGADWLAPQTSPSPVGCDRLIDWLNSVTPLPRGTARQASPQDAPPPEPQVQPGFEQPLLLVAGKGGVGKSTVAAALAVAREDKRLCLISTDPAGSLSEVLGHRVGAEAESITPQLRAWQVDADAQYERMRSSYTERVAAVFEQLGLDRTLALDHAVIDRLWNLAPSGLDEIVALTELLASDANCSQTILDTAPTGHFLRLLQMPELAAEWARAVLRVLLRYRLAASLEDFTGEVLDFARRTRHLRSRLTAAEETGVVLVTTDEPVVWSETERLHRALVDANIPVAALIVNRAEAGPLRGHLLMQTMTRVIRAPRVATPLTGPAALRAFLARWEVVK